MTSNPRDPATQLEALYTDMAANSVKGLWSVTRSGPDVRSYLWPWETMKRLVTEAGRLVEIDRPGERRAVALVNPGLADGVSATHTLYAAIQLVRPGEVARAHRHTPAALRFMIQGIGASTTIEGGKVPMHAGDLVLTPNWLWHEHRNEGTEDVLWLDGLDSPFVFSLAAAIYEPYEDGFLPESKPLDYSAKAFGLGSIRPLAAAEPLAGTPLLVYRWEAIEEAIGRLAEVEAASPHDGVAIEYANQATGGHTLPTISCCMQMLRPGEHTQAHRHTYAPVHLVHRGTGYTVIEGERYDWAAGDSFVVPPWAWHEHANMSDSEPAYLFSMNDLPVLESFNLNREESYTQRDGRQQQTSVFARA